MSLSKDDIISLIEPISVYSKVIEPGLARVIMFSMQGDKIMEEGLSSIIDVKFEGNNSSINTNISISDLILAGINGVAIECEKDATFDLDLGMPLETSLDKNFPNPFNPSTTIPFQLERAGYVTLKIYDMNGGLVKTLASDYRDAGTYEMIWNGLNNDGQQVASGQYILKMNAPSYSNTLQMTFIK